MNEGLYLSGQERDACGTGLLANLTGQPTHQLVQDALLMLSNMEHRGARGSDPDTGDGAGILVQVPHGFFMKVCPFDLPEAGEYGVGMIFFPKDDALRERCKEIIAEYCDRLGFRVLGYREVPTYPDTIGLTAQLVEPCMEQLFVTADEAMDQDRLERRLYILRKSSGHRIHAMLESEWDAFYITSFSSRTICYKGQLTTGQLGTYFPDLWHPAFRSAIALVHSRFSTNTFPKWKLAQPFRMIAHNGEINTIRGNINSWRAREQLLTADRFTEEEIELLNPICGREHSDSASFDNVLEFLVMSGFSVAHALMMMIPEAWQQAPDMPDHKRAFYEFTRSLMEPWDGPASICFTDGTLVGATLDRNGLRPSRYLLTDDHTLVVSSEAGALPIDQGRIVKKGRLQSGKMLIADLDEHRIIGDDELKDAICKRLPYREWLDEHRMTLEDIPSASEKTDTPDSTNLIQRQQLFGFTREDLKTILVPMVLEGKDPVGSMGADFPPAVLSRQSQHLASYFRQNFAQVTNPPIDPIRERSVMSLYSTLGGVTHLMKARPENARFIHLSSPILDRVQLQSILQQDIPGFKTTRLDMLFEGTRGNGSLEAGIDQLCEAAVEAVGKGSTILVLSDRNSSRDQLPMPSLLAAAAVHHHLISQGLRSSTSLVVEAGDVREVHHFATLIGYGVHAICPWLTLETLEVMASSGALGDLDFQAAQQKYVKAVGKGLLKVMSKIGISTLHSYRGAQTFEALGLGDQVVQRCFPGTISRIQGLGFDDLAREVAVRHRLAFTPQTERPVLPEGGVFQWKHRGEAHLFNPQSIHLLQRSVKANDYTCYKRFAARINDQQEQALTLRGLLRIKKGKAIPLEEVEPVEEIFRRFATGAMSFGSISHEAHSTLARAMNRIGGKSNSGEGGEDEKRYVIRPDGDLERSAIKQVASGRFGVTSHYLSQADEIQIKMAQGAKPGEGGQLPGHKVDEWIARVRHSTPGVPLISPPPHHDIYSIEDLAQLIFDLKNTNPEARINVKLVSKAGVGVIASGVAKAHADVIMISGHDGGTGASPLTSIRHAGLPWELGLAETHQTLLLNGLRKRVTLQADGQIRTGRDLAIATLLGAEEWGIATAALVVEGCILMRKCHLNTCPVGIATQDPELRKRFAGKVDHLIHYFTFLAEDLREIMASLGYRTVQEMVGQVQHLEQAGKLEYWKYKGIDLSPILHQQAVQKSDTPYQSEPQDHGLANVLDHQLIAKARPALEHQLPVSAALPIRNTDRATGAMLSWRISQAYGGKGLPKGTIRFQFRGSAGQSFGAFCAPGMELKLEGEANDYVGKGLSGGRLIIRPDRLASFEAANQIVIGNVSFYGATSGEAFINGQAGERFAVRNSGARIVVEGVGDHGCEYMTGGEVIILGAVGENFAAGMSGGIAYVWDPDQCLEDRYNPSMVDLEVPEKDALHHLKVSLKRHLRFTESSRAQWLLENWEEQQHHFRRVMPRAFKAALAKMKQDSDQAEILTKTT